MLDVVTHDAVTMEEVYMTCSNRAATSAQKLSATTAPLDRVDPTSLSGGEMRELEGQQTDASRMRALGILQNGLGPRYSSGRAIAAATTRKTLPFASVVFLARKADAS